MKLRTKFALVLLALTLVLSLATYAGLETYKNQEIRRTQDNVAETASLVAEQLESRLDDRRDYVAFIAQRAAATPDDREVVAELLDNSRFFAAQVVDANRTTVVIQGPYPAERRRELLGQRDRSECVVETLRTGDICTTAPRAGSPGGDHYVVISAPIIRDEAVVGVLSAAIPMNEHTFFSLLEPLQRDTQLVRVTAGDTLLSGRRATFPTNVSATATVPSTGWEVSVQRDRTALAQRLRGLAYVQALAIFLVGLLAVGIGYWEFRVTFTQTTRLLDAFGAIGRGEYDTRLSLSSSEEWIQISEGFNRLASRLDARERELQKQRQRIEVLNRVLRHTLRNEMNLIIGWTQDLRDGTADDPDQVVDAIGDVAWDIVETSRKARHIETALAGDDAPAPVDVVPLVTDAVAQVETAYPTADISVDAPETATAQGRAVLTMAVAELLENACRYAAREAPQVTVSVSAADEGAADEVTIAVSDRGPGIPASELAVLERGHETALEHTSGLGLWAVNWIVEECNGRLLFEDGGEGTTVRIVLEAASPD